MKKLFFIISAMFLPFSSNAWEACGTDADGNTANCEYQIINGTLTIRGVGNNGNIGYWHEVDEGNGYKTTAPWGNNASQIQNVVIGEGIKDVGSYAFVGIKSNISIEVPSGVTTISSNAFYSFNASEIKLPDTVTSIDYSAFNWSSITKIDIPDSVDTLLGACFRGAWALKDVVVPDSIHYIPSNTFSYTDLGTLTIGENTILGSIFSDDILRVDLSKLKVYCTGDTSKCDENLAEAGYSDLKSEKATAKTINGVTYVYDKNGKLITTSGTRKEKRIYTIEEANQVAGTTNRVSIKYK